ncbi:MAG: TlpA family protein disulfide reductase [Pseudobacter sp.]|uniref:TlpA family protein disulfide reductase n=1 Tax=Pseudobacter sp. TaxID=2045420 RepID=UPI003F7DC900
MKSKFLVLGAILIACLYTNAQQSLTEVDAGSMMPDIELGTVLNHKGEAYNGITGKTKISDLKGKLLILDFWTTNCSACIEGFPHGAELQKKFGDKIQFLLVNADESPESIKKWLEILKKNKGHDETVPSSLPMVINPVFKKLFPSRGEIGYHVWIDGKGMIRLRGINQNTHSKKIEELLAGKEISFVPDNARLYKPEVAYAVSANANGGKSVKFNSNFSVFDPNIASAYGTGVTNEIDSIAGTRRNSTINIDAAEIYWYFLRDTFKGNKKIIAGKNIVVDMPDPSILGVYPPYYNGEITDETYRKTKYSYEQIVPLSVSEADQRKMALEDLNKYFSTVAGFAGAIEKRSVPCLKIVRTSTVDKLKDTNKYKQVTMIEGKAFVRYEGPAHEVFYNFLWNTTSHRGAFANKLIVDETQYDGTVNIRLPYCNSAEEYRAALRKYDLDIVPGVATVEVLVLKGNKTERTFF